MKATETLLNNFLSQNKTQFVIPVYQRNYDWSVAQCKQLLLDIVETGSKPDGSHFIGSIVYIHDGVFVSTEVKPLVVIDGQQRLTTITILYMALHDYVLQTGNKEKADEIQDTFLLNKYVKDDSNKLKLKQSAGNAAAFRALFLGKKPEEHKEYSKVIDNYIFFRQQITDQNFDVILNGLSRLLFVEVSLERGKDDPQRIFESLNSTGLELSQADLIRNYILMGLSPDEQNHIFELYWEPIECNARSIEFDESRVSDFIRDFLTIKMGRIPNKAKVYEEFKKKYTLRNEKFYNEVLPELKSYSAIYSKILNTVYGESNDRLSRQLAHIRKLEVVVCYPFLIQVMSDFNNQRITQDDFIKVLDLIQSYVWRRFLVGLPTNALNKVFMNLYNEVDPDQYVYSIEVALARKKGVARFPGDQEVADAFVIKDMYSIQAKNRLYYFDRLENLNNKELVDIENKIITVEHIFPQTPDATWEADLSPDEFELFKEKYINTPGNLTLSGNNGSLSNRRFTEKKSMNRDGKEQGYIYSRLWLNRYLSQIDKWDLAAYKERTQILLERVLQIWPALTAEATNETELDEDYTIYDAPDPTHRKLDYFIYRDEKVETSDVATMYYSVLRALYQENPSMFHHADFREMVPISTNSQAFRFPVVLEEPYYIEGNVNNKDKFKVLRFALERFGREEDLLINFSQNEIDEPLTLEQTFWHSRISLSVSTLLDELLESIKFNVPTSEPSYSYYYIGFRFDYRPRNFIVLMPTKDFVRCEVHCSNIDDTKERLRNAGFKVLGTGLRSKRLKFRLTLELYHANRQLVHEIVMQSYKTYFEVD